MAMVFEAQAVPLRTDEDGVIRVGNTRITLTTLVYAFDQGYTAEEIISDYPALHLADVYAVISYYLNNQDAVAAYLREQNSAAEAIRRAIEAKPDYRLFRERLLARAEARGIARPK